MIRYLYAADSMALVRYLPTHGVGTPFDQLSVGYSIGLDQRRIPVRGKPMTDAAPQGVREGLARKLPARAVGRVEETVDEPWVKGEARGGRLHSP